jgi:hypothetical protein
MGDRVNMAKRDRHVRTPVGRDWRPTSAVAGMNALRNATFWSDRVCNSSVWN